MPSRRISLSPVLATPGEQKALLALMDDRPELQSAMANITGLPFEGLSKQGKLAALRDLQKSGMAIATVARSARLIRDVLTEGAMALNDPELMDENKRLRRKLRKARKYIAELEARLENDKLEETG